MNTAAAWLQQTFGLSPAMQQRLFASLLAIVTVWLVRRIVLVLAFRHVDDAAARYRIRKISMYAAVPMGILLVGRIWFEGLQSIATFFGLLSAGLAIALKDLIVNLAG